ncbi:hypothetical protein ABH922_001607 [Rhodococcus sp. 27YEA15]|uniref:hypothetical protein n=1 Tax=Rhodococcus sp. 27YEA15 TaxID=3156259 RepID=UPI003C7BC99E
MTHHMRPTSTSTLSVLIAVLIAITVSATGCGGEPGDADSRSTRHSTGTVADITTEAVDFSGIAIPEGVTVLAAHTESALDTLYQLTLLTDPEGLTKFLSASNFTTPLTKGGVTFLSPIAGPRLDTSPSVVETWDRIQRPNGQLVNRSVTVDERDATTRYIHLMLYTT